MNYRYSSKVRILLATILLVSVPSLQAIQRVASIQALEVAVEQAEPGAIIMIEDGTYNQPADLKTKGRSGNPVKILAQSLGGVTFTRPVSVSGAWITMGGVNFREQAKVTIKGTGIRLFRSTFSDCQSTLWVLVEVGSRQVEIDHCLFENKNINRTQDRACQVMRLVVKNKGERHHIHHNHFRNIPEGKGSNGYETIQLITHRNPFDPPGSNCGTRIEDNLFEQCSGEGEIISVKSNGNLIRRNTFRGCRGELTLRHGHRNVAAQNFFFGEGERGSGGVRLQGRDQIVTDNYFQGLGRRAIAMMDGTPDKLYMPVKRARILHNTIIDCGVAMEIGLNHSKHPNGKPPANCEVIGNAFVNSDPWTSLIRYVQNDLPQQWTWQDNYYTSRPGVPATSGLVQADLAFTTKHGGLALPTTKTPTRTRQKGDSSADFDILGIQRRQNTAVGAIELSEQKPKHGPLGAQQVGPLAP
jgi:poly(beta-D-mannuronate) lyase